jgi:hypothetical protein
MTRAWAVLLVATLAFVATGCVIPYGAPNNGGLVTMNVKGPVAGVDNSVGMSKVGVAESMGVLFFTQGDASIKAAMDNGGITKVHHVDSESFHVLGLYSVYKTIVYGE